MLCRNDHAHNDDGSSILPDCGCLSPFVKVYRCLVSSASSDHQTMLLPPSTVASRESPVHRCCSPARTLQVAHHSMESGCCCRCCLASCTSSAASCTVEGRNATVDTVALHSFHAITGAGKKKREKHLVVTRSKSSATSPKDSQLEPRRSAEIGLEESTLPWLLLELWQHPDSALLARKGTSCLPSACTCLRRD